MSLLLLLSLNVSGCLESSFTLSGESRIPQWFELPGGKNRSDFYVTMDYYSDIDGSKAVFKLYEKNHYFYTKKIKTKISDSYIELKNPPNDSPKGYPSFLIIKINDVTEVIEHKKMEPIFYIVDDPAILAELGVKK
jgi:hypothetical protein